MSEIPAVLNAKVLIAGLMADSEPWYVSSGWRSEIGDYGRAVIDDVTHEKRMRVGEVVVSPDHAVVLISSAFIGGDQVCGSVPVVCSICWGKQREELLYARINSDRNTATRVGVAARSSIAGRGQQALMSKGIGDRRNRRGCLHFTEAFVAGEKECAVMHDWAADGRAELVAHEWWDRRVTQIKVVLGVEGSISVQFEQRSVVLVTARFGRCFDNTASISTVLWANSMG